MSSCFWTQLSISPRCWRVIIDTKSRLAVDGNWVVMDAEGNSGVARASTMIIIIYFFESILEYA